MFPNANIYVFHEDYTEEDMQGLPPVTRYIKVDFSGFESIYNLTLPTSRGYLMMCRFFSGVVQRHPVLQSYTHYMRLDDDSYFLEPYISDSHVRSLLQHDYVFRAVFHENKSQQTLYEFTIKFIARFVNPIQLLQIKRKLVARQFLTESGAYTGLAPYNNFHLSSLRLWNHPRVRQYIDAIEASGGIFRNGWLDANIHAMVVYIFPYIIPSLSVTSDASFGYRHNHHVCPVGALDARCDETIPFYPRWLDATIDPEELTAPDVSIPLTGKRVFVTFANTNYMPLDRIRAHAENMRVFDEIRAHTELDFPAFFDKHRDFIQGESRMIGYGRWIWKPMIILETLLSVAPGDLVVYADAGVHLNKRGLPRFAEYVAMLEEPTSIVAFATPFAFGNGYACPGAVQSYFPEVRCEDHRYHYAGILMIRRTEESIQFVREWLSLCENYAFLCHPGGDGDNGLYNLCLAKNMSIVRSIYPDEVKPSNEDWSTCIAFPLQARRVRPSR